MDTSIAPATRLSARGLRLAYDGHVVVDDLSIDIPDGGFTIIVGPNACGKSTLLKALSRTLKPVAGTVLLGGRAIESYRSKAVARQVALLPQGPIAPESITVRDLVGRGRFPHQSLWRQWSAEDERAVAAALIASGSMDLARRHVAELSGGQRQRVWMAMVLAQQTDLLLLDEPTTFLDIAHQYDVLELCSRLHADGRTLVAVLHDLNQAARYATNLVVMKEGRIVASGEPAKIVTAELVEQVFGLPCLIAPDPVTGTPMVVARRAKAVRTPDAAHDRLGLRPRPPRSTDDYQTGAPRRDYRDRRRHLPAERRGIDTDQAGAHILGKVASASTAEQAGFMAHKFAVGDHVRWNSEAGHVSGTITKVHTKDVDYKGHMHRCSPDDPQYEIKSDKTDHIALHKGSALTKK